MIVADAWPLYNFSRRVSMRFVKFFLRLLCVLLILCLLGGLCAVTLSAWVVSRARPQILSAEAAAAWEADCILVLGAGVREGGRPSAMLAERLDAAVELYGSGAAPKLLMSGDHGREHYDEVNVMKDWALAAGVPSEDVFMDHAGFSTYESIYRARDVFQARRVLIVTQQYHLYRALYIASALGLEARGVACDTQRYYGQFYRELREVLARDKDVLQCILKPEPTYLGPAIPVSGSGDATNDRG